MNLDQLLRDSAPDSSEMRRHAERMRPDVVAGFAAPEAHRPHSRRRWAAGLAAAAAAATTYVVISPGGPAVSPAYAVEQQADGDVVVTIHRLEDADGLEAALRANGIDASVNFDEMAVENQFSVQEPDLDGLPPREPGVIPDCDIEGDPATLGREGDDWVLLIPAESPLQDQPVYMTTKSPGALDLAYASLNDPWTYCAVLNPAS